MRHIRHFRAMDKLGRVVLPIIFRRKFNIKNQDDIEILVDNDCIILRKYEPACVFCNSIEALTKFRGKNVCSECQKTIGNGEG